MAEPLLTISDLSIGFKEDLVRDISLEVHSGEVIAVLGPSGIGKTTLVRTIAGLVPPRQGTLELQLSSQGGLGYIPQRLGLVRHASVYHNVNLGARASLPLLKGKREERMERVVSALSAVGLRKFVSLFGDYQAGKCEGLQQLVLWHNGQSSCWLTNF